METEAYERASEVGTHSPTSLVVPTYTCFYISFFFLCKKRCLFTLSLKALASLLFFFSFLFFFLASTKAESALALLHAQLAEAAERTAILVESNPALSGHSNTKQKIHQHIKLKEEINELQRHNYEMHQRLHRAELNEARLLAYLAAAGIDLPTGDKVWPTSPARAVGGNEGNENKHGNATASSIG